VKDIHAKMDELLSNIRQM